MDRHLSVGFQIPQASMHVFQDNALLPGLTLYACLFVPAARRFTGPTLGISYLIRMSIEMAIVSLAAVSAPLVKAKRESVAAAHSMLDELKAVVPMSVFPLMPQYAIFGSGESFIIVGNTEFLYNQAQECIRSTTVALFWLSSSIEQCMSTFPVSFVSSDTRRKGEWLQDTINKEKLDFYCCLVIGLQVLYSYARSSHWRWVRPENEIPSRILDQKSSGVMLVHSEG